MKTLSLDLRERIVALCDEKRLSQRQVAEHYQVSFGMVRKLLAQRKKLGTIKSLNGNAGRRSKILPEHRSQFAVLIKAQPDITLKELRQKTGLACTLTTISNALIKQGFSFKKRR